MCVQYNPWYADTLTCVGSSHNLVLNSCTSPPRRIVTYSIFSMKCSAKFFCVFSKTIILVWRNHSPSLVTIRRVPLQSSIDWFMIRSSITGIPTFSETLCREKLGGRPYRQILEDILLHLQEPQEKSTSFDCINNFISRSDYCQVGHIREILTEWVIYFNNNSECEERPNPAVMQIN